MALTEPRFAGAGLPAQDLAGAAVDPDLHLIVGGQRRDPIMVDGRITFALDLPCGDVQLMSRAGRPAAMGINRDGRLLGYGLVGLAVLHAGQRIHVPVDHPALVDGLNEVEPSGIRWTTGAAVLPAALFDGMRGPAELRVEGMPLRQYPAARPDAMALFARFQSLGDDCEFGLLQRAFDAEPFDLLRWIGNDAAQLVLGLCRRFEGVGDPALTRLEWRDDVGEYRLIDPRYFTAHTWHSERLAVPEREEALRLAGCARLRLLRRKLLADIELGRRIFVFKVSSHVPPLGSFVAVHAALRGIGPAPLLCVTRAATPDRMGLVEDLGDGLYLGHIDQFSRTTISFATWRRICAGTAALVDAAAGMTAP